MKRIVWIGFEIEDENIDDDEFYDGYTDYAHVEDLLEVEGLYNFISEEDYWLVSVIQSNKESEKNV